ncbi:hypothetical protein DLAC_09788 [Tieghemostelium lacteum]|uniref:Uncharacterized protein n=1 Tax=Tieghemostelium lacteum TaxID=361077 RepID=A0A151Z7A3_TIELA|nr:hypothetical protein DLAC_09788 [Tieghemostelium lacteum]|eukprot:KYQ89815.1 hypothetical protein DLAC_09788 [Tieghemostelium lacteum]
MKLSLFVIIAVVAVVCQGQLAPQKNYEIKVNVQPIDVATIAQMGLNVMISANQVISDGYNTILTSFSPWTKNFVEYNSTGISVFAAINTTDLQPVFVGDYQYSSAGYLYTFDGSTFNYGISSDFVKKNQFGILNNDDDIYFFGLAQDISVNGDAIARSPLFSFGMMEYEHIVFTNPTSFSIFLGSNLIETGTAFQNIEDVAETPVTVFEITNPKGTITLHFNAQTGKFEI